MIKVCLKDTSNSSLRDNLVKICRRRLHRWLFLRYVYEVNDYPLAGILGTIKKDKTMKDNQLSRDEIAQLTDSDWRQRLSPDEYHVMREKGTERPFTGAYNDLTDKGVYRCKGCGAELFHSENKFDAGCGWPSFDQTANHSAINEHLDTSHGMRRTEVTCSNCGAHLGHVFSDGPRDTTGMRYCINSVSLDFDKSQ